MSRRKAMRQPRAMTSRVLLATDSVWRSTGGAGSHGARWWRSSGLPSPSRGQPAGQQRDGPPLSGERRKRCACQQSKRLTRQTLLPSTQRGLLCRRTRQQPPPRLSVDWTPRTPPRRSVVPPLQPARIGVEAATVAGAPPILRNRNIAAAPGHVRAAAAAASAAPSVPLRATPVPNVAAASLVGPLPTQDHPALPAAGPRRLDYIHQSLLTALGVLVAAGWHTEFGGGCRVLASVRTELAGGRTALANGNVEQPKASPRQELSQLQTGGRDTSQSSAELLKR
jgi:hypothetical protein